MKDFDDIKMHGTAIKIINVRVLIAAALYPATSDSFCYFHIQTALDFFVSFR
jgi:hypothetical protein